MKRFFISFFFLFINFSPFYGQNQAANNFNEIKKIINYSQQIIVVISNNWSANTAVMNYFEKKKNKFTAVGENIYVNLGKNGLGWGRGLVNFDQTSGPIKHEGDKKSPAGIFKLSLAFGFLSADSLPQLHFPYKQITESIECVDDTTSVYYNTLVDAKDKIKNWKSSEMMKSIPVYKYGIFVEHNSNPQVPACGSCIFLHVWNGPRKPTTGCTSMDEEEIIKIIKWLDAKKKPLLIQLTLDEFEKIKFLIRLEE